MAKAPTKQPTVRVNQAAKQKLDKIQAQTELSQPVLSDRAIDLLERDMLAQQLESDFNDLASDPDMFRRYNELSEAFDGACGDSGITG